MRRKRRWGSVVAWAFACGCGATVLADPAALDWEAAFPIETAAKDVHLEAHFLGSDGTTHRLQLWRHGTQFLHRRTDEVLDLYLSKAGNKGDYAYRLIDHRRRVSMDVRRNQLYRIGVFSDWFGLAHVLDRPKSEFVARAVDPLPQEKKERQMDCAWRLLVRGGKESPDRSRICWSAEWGLPLAIRTRGPKGEWIERFTVDLVEGISPSVVEPWEGSTPPATSSARQSQTALTRSVDGLALPPVPDGYAYFDTGSEIDPE